MADCLGLTCFAGCRSTSDGRPYYVDHNTQATHWQHPKQLGLLGNPVENFSKAAASSMGPSSDESEVSLLEHGIPRSSVFYDDGVACVCSVVPFLLFFLRTCAPEQKSTLPRWKSRRAMILLLNVMHFMRHTCHYFLFKTQRCKEHTTHGRIRVQRPVHFNSCSL